ncbi:tail fiber domain-containing protein [Brumimicrobium glaciale]|nr:tail fiber domain-containing protein [Brumimicrobium glaciale]
MKKQILVLCLLVSTMTILKAQDNLSEGPVETYNNTGITQLNGEIFRFKPGLVTQLQSGTSFNFDEDWFALGKITAGTQDFYGLRFQQFKKGLTMGYTSAAPNKPRIEWVHSGGPTAGFLEFRVGTSLGSSGSPGTNVLVASMSPLQGNTYFGDIVNLGNPFLDNANSPEVGILTRGQIGLSIRNQNSNSTTGNNIGAAIRVEHGSNNGNGMIIDCVGGESSIGIRTEVASSLNSIGVRSTTNTNTQFSAAIYGDAQLSGSNRHAGYFNGDVLVTAGTFTVSDEKLKQNINNEKSALERIALLRPVTYTFNKTEGIALPETNQHGFVSQEMAEVFPELTKDVTQPVFDEDGKIVSDISYKAINYTGLISVLTAGIQELNSELVDIREELAEYKANDKIRESLVQDSREVSDYSMEQNIPNPFNDRTVIRYQLAPNVEQASITIFNLNGGFVKDYPINENKGEITILASEIGKGMFIYSLTRNGQEIMSKRMIVR